MKSRIAEGTTVVSVTLGACIPDSFTLFACHSWSGGDFEGLAMLHPPVTKQENRLVWAPSRSDQCLEVTYHGKIHIFGDLRALLLLGSSTDLF